MTCEQKCGACLDCYQHEAGALRTKMIRAKELLREWRDKWGGKEHHAYKAMGSVSPTDLLVDTNHFLEGR